MLAKVFSCAIIGLDGATIETEVDISNGLPGLTIVGLPDAANHESKERAPRLRVSTSPFLCVTASPTSASWGSAARNACCTTPAFSI